MTTKKIMIIMYVESLIQIMSTISIVEVKAAMKVMMTAMLVCFLNGLVFFLFALKDGAQPGYLIDILILFF